MKNDSRNECVISRLTGDGPERMAVLGERLSSFGDSSFDSLSDHFEPRVDFLISTNS